MRALRTGSRGCPEPMEVPEGGHFLQEWGAPVAGAAAVGGAVATFLPFAVIAPSGTWHMFSYHLHRPSAIGSNSGRMSGWFHRSAVLRSTRLSFTM